ncbi:coiled-coil-helix-coiled-coil-helix domain-containing protein 1 [Hemiscyllium ocellatum]|uniref:coiled-coil-helix-coiled-coil-helix domain-containing protein 1 n=1 Tax=Hemiscyllium ocellatum TaxID=170820 RepID=UPI0029663FAF|nr:coiled-coil-helix-coiled-coil-helix domain-containing protein 1 [Hemiscyllium ocellatum]
MALSGSALQAKVSRLVSRQHGRPVLKPNKALVLADRVANRKMRLGEATCITEMSVMLACWKQNEFSERACAKEIQAFYACTAKAEAERRARASLLSVGQTNTLTPQQATKLLQRYPNKTQVR